jgi:hypothetical protein
VTVAGFLLSIVCAALLGCSEPTPGSKLYITGDADTVGAEIYLDGKPVGVMERRTYSGASAAGDHELRPSPSPMKPGGVDLRVARGEKRAKYGVYDEVRATRGSHEIAFVSVDGRRLVKRIDVGEKADVGVSFLEMRISGGE